MLGYIAPPRERYDSKINLNTKKFGKLYERLRHPTNESFTEPLLDQEFETELNAQEKSKSISVSNNCLSCAKYAELPRTFKLTLLPSRTSNIAVTLDVMHYNDKSLQMKLFAMLDAGDPTLRTHQLHDDSARTALRAYF